MTTSNEHNNGPAVPQGWKLVPIEPTLAMGEAYLSAARLHAADGAEDKMRFSPGGYAAMLAATPATAPAQDLHSVIDAFERKERGIPQAHIAAQLCDELRKAILAAPAQEPMSLDDAHAIINKHWRNLDAVETATEIAMIRDVEARHRIGVQQVAAPAQYKDSTPQLSVGESSFESWFESYNPANKGDKQRARDAYAAGMGDPLVTVTPAQEVASAFTKALDIRLAQGWNLTRNAIPVLYTDTINDYQVRRDDVWLCTTDALKTKQEVGLTDGDLLNWIERQDLEELSMGFVIDAPHDGEYYVNGDDNVTYYGKTLREALKKAISAKGGK